MGMNRSEYDADWRCGSSLRLPNGYVIDCEEHHGHKHPHCATRGSSGTGPRIYEWNDKDSEKESK